MVKMLFIQDFKINKNKMLVTEIYNGSGLGNQLFNYVVTRSIALDNGYEFGIMSPHKFKGHDFLSLDFGKEVIGGSSPFEGAPPTELPQGITNYYAEKKIWYDKFNCDIRIYDKLLHTVPDNTKIEGYMQAEEFFMHRKEEVKQWLKVKEEKDCYDFSNENTCVLNIRGGEYLGVPELILPRTYWLNAINNMCKVNKDLNFIIITDDVRYCNHILPEYPAYHFDIGKDYSIIKNAHYLILSNSSFAFFPTWTSETVKYVIAPKYWARPYSDGFWACGFNLYRDWMWQDTSGNLFTYQQCKDEFDIYIKSTGIYENI